LEDGRVSEPVPRWLVFAGGMVFGHGRHSL
jgi:hypothetical protein